MGDLPLPHRLGRRAVAPGGVSWASTLLCAPLLKHAWATRRVTGRARAHVVCVARVAKSVAMLDFRTAGSYELGVAVARALRTSWRMCVLRVHFWCGYTRRCEFETRRAE